jgi:glycosyltransferase involved in cell wall biosynthesis
MNAAAAYERPEDFGSMAVVSHSHPSLTKGGAEIAAYTLYTGLTALGYDASFIAACSESDRHKLCLGSSHESAVFYDPSAYDHFHQIAAPGLAGALRRALPKHTRLVNFHHFFHFGIGAVRSIAEDPGIVSVLTLHELLSICHHHGQMITKPAHILCTQSSPQACVGCFPDYTRQEFALRRRAFLDSYRHLDGFVSPSRFLVERYVSWGVARERCAVIENGLLKHETSEESRKSGPFTFGFFGQINPFKGVDVVLRAAEAIMKLPALANRVRIQIHGNVIGQPPAFVERLLKLVETIPFLSYLGPYSNTDVIRLMSACDYVLVPSLWWENSPVVIQEAYAARRPVICTGIGGMAEKVANNVSGLHFRLNDHMDLVSAMERGSEEETFQRLQRGLPEVIDYKAMAQEYCRNFMRFGEAKWKSRARLSASII